MEEVLSRGITDLIDKTLMLPYHVLRTCLIVSHSHFANDNLIFLNGHLSSLQNLMHFLEAYQMASR